MTRNPPGCPLLLIRAGLRVGQDPGGALRDNRTGQSGSGRPPGRSHATVRGGEQNGTDRMDTGGQGGRAAVVSVPRGYGVTAEGVGITGDRNGAAGRGAKGRGVSIPSGELVGGGRERIASCRCVPVVVRGPDFNGGKETTMNRRLWGTGRRGRRALLQDAARTLSAGGEGSAAPVSKCLIMMLCMPIFFFGNIKRN